MMHLIRRPKTSEDIGIYYYIFREERINSISSYQRDMKLLASTTIRIPTDRTINDIIESGHEILFSAENINSKDLERLFPEDFV